MAMSDDEKYLLVTLYNGHSVEEQQGNKPGHLDTYPLIRSNFKTYEIRFDLSTFKLNRTNEDLFKDNYQMLNLHQLGYAIDSLDRQLDERKEEISTTVKSYYMTFRDSALWKKTTVPDTSENAVDSLTALGIYENALGQARNVKAFLKSSAEEIDSRGEMVSRFYIEWHRKYTLSIACFILFLIGAPLGAIIRKGGIGMPVVVSVLFFLVFHVTSIMGEKFAREGVIEPYIGMWIAPAVLLPVGLFLLYKATHDSALFDPEAYTRIFKRIFRSRAA
jgi:lipopolysaccharide export system permease protein